MCTHVVTCGGRHPSRATYARPDREVRQQPHRAVERETAALREVALRTAALMVDREAEEHGAEQNAEEHREAEAEQERRPGAPNEQAPLRLAGAAVGTSHT